MDVNWCGSSEIKGMILNMCDFMLHDGRVTDSVNSGDMGSTTLEMLYELLIHK